MDEIVINLSNPHRGTQNIEIKWNVTIEPKKHLFGFLKNHQHIEKTVYLGISNIEVDDAIVCDIMKLFTIEYANTLYSVTREKTIEIPLATEDTPFLLSIDKDAITDCKEQQQADIKEYKIAFDVTLHDAKDRLIDTSHQQLSVRFEALNVQPKVQLDINIKEPPKKDTKSLQYSSLLQEVKVGDMVVWVEQDWQYTADVNLSVDLKVFINSKELPGQVYFKEGSERKTKTTVVVKHSRTNLKKLPVYMSFEHVSNPVADVQPVTIAYRSHYTMAYSPDIICPMNEQMNQFFLLKDQQGTELQVVVTDNKGTDLGAVESNHTVYMVPECFVPMSRMTPQMSIDLRNIATDNGNPLAGLIVKDLTVTDDLGRFKLRDKDDMLLASVTTIDSVNDEDCDRMRSTAGLFIANGHNAHSQLLLTFNPSQIASVLEAGPDCDFRVDTTVSFNYCENRDGKPLSELQFKQFVLPVMWQLQLLPYPQWLCVDYGSSAIVCKYDDTILDLNAQKDKVFKEAYADVNPDWLKENYEKGTPFLSSDALLQTVSGKNQSALCTEQAERQRYNTLAVCLSPTSNLIAEYRENQLPCMKILVGNVFLPDSRDYKTYQYPCLDKSGGVVRVTAKDSRQNPKSLLRVSSLFEETYSELFRYFVVPAIKKSIDSEMSMRRMNKLVLTYPNTYTPVHLRTLRNIVQKAFPYLREGYLEFVSESDAVAAYYVSKWNEFNPHRDIRNQERVLVYDMGAGTLDITLFDKFANKDKLLEVCIMAKIGTGKAGSYLDFIIAQIISQKADGVIPYYVVNTSLPPNKEARRLRQELKDFVKTQVKPNLVSGEKFEFKLDKEGKLSVNITADEIINHDLFKNFLQDVSKDILTQMQAYMGESDLHIDTVIMSGRSCSMTILRQAVKQALGQQAHFVFLDNKDKHAVADRQKTVVVDGAVAKVSRYNQAESEVVIKSRRLYASYGLIFQVLGGRFKYQELLNHNDIPYIADNKGTYESKNVTVSGTANSEKIKLVQTYMSAEDTEEAYNSGNLEFIADMEEHDMDNFGKANQLNVRLRLDKNNNVSLLVNGTPSLGSAPQGVDLTSDITKRSIWPVTF